MTGKWKKVEEGSRSNEYTREFHKSRKSKFLDKTASSEGENSPPRRYNKRHDSSSENDNSPKRKKRHDSSSDNSPRYKKRHDSSTDADSPVSTKRQTTSVNKGTGEYNSDISPPRQRNKRSPSAKSDSDASPPRKRNNINVHKFCCL